MKRLVIVTIVFLGLASIKGAVDLYAEIYNGIVGAHQEVDKSLADLDAEYQRRYALVDNLVVLVKETKAFETSLVGVEADIYRRVAEAKASATRMDVAVPDSVQARLKSESALGNFLVQAMDKLMVMAQHYPTITDPPVKERSETFTALRRLRDDLTTLEGTILAARQTLNEQVRVHNHRVVVFPATVIARWHGFVPLPFFEVQDADARDDVKISF